jgi:cytochrome oxidase Cu insertion factor (SCO1/SenC/PrrC family)
MSPISFLQHAQASVQKCRRLMKKVHDQDDFVKLNDFKLVSFTVDPEHDTPEVLKEFCK